METVNPTNVVTWICASAMMFGGVIPYIPQYREIRKTTNADGFSTYVCLVLLIANTLRIIFWFGHPFELPLLLQSIIMNAAMLAMVNLCVHVRNKTLIVPAKAKLFSALVDEGKTDTKPLHSSPIPRSYWGAQDDPFLSYLITLAGNVVATLVYYMISMGITNGATMQRGPTFTDFDAKYFWEWTDFLSYLEFLATFTAVMGIFMYFCIELAFAVEALGFLAVFTEAMLGTPQFYRNLKKKSTLGMSKKMVFLWTLGDIFKTAYFIVREAPTQFWLCGILQVAIDLSILLQVLIYKVTPSPVKLLLKGQSHTS